MFKPAEILQARRWWLVRAAALAGITTNESLDASKAPVMATGTFQVRCWQQDRLLFEENHVSLPADSAKYGLKMSGTDRNGKPIYVADNATRLIRSWPR
jgi:hypothetical protein